MRLIIATSTGLRHMYFASRIAEHFEVAGVLAEPKVFDPAQAYVTEEEQRVLGRWFALRDDEEERSFGAQARAFSRTFDGIRTIDPGGINDPEVVRWMEGVGPTAVVVFGTSLLRKAFLEAAGGDVLNMHLGLSPYYRGSGTNFWPFYNEELEFVGVTIHRIDLGVDTGPIVRQGRPTVVSGDNAHSIGNNAIAVGADLMIRSLHDLWEGALASHPQRSDVGRQYRRADFAARHVVAVSKMIDEGLIERYAAAPPPPVDLVS